MGVTFSCALWSALSPALIGVFASLLAVVLTNKHTRRQAVRQRQIVATQAIIQAAYGMVRHSYRSDTAFRDSGSLLETAVRAFAADVLATDEPFVVELMEWTKRLQQDCLRLRPRHPWGRHDPRALRNVQWTTHLFVDYISNWMCTPARSRKRWAPEMSKQREVLWPEWRGPMRQWP